MKYRLVTLIFLILFTISCASIKVEHEVRQPDGQPFPDPYYVLQTTDPQRPIRASFFYSSLEAIKDLDQAKVFKTKFLHRRDHFYFSKDSEDELHLTVRVLNPRNMRYKVFINFRIKYSDGGITDSYSIIAYSDMKYREFIRDLPTWDGIKEVSYSLEIKDKAENPLISTGKFNYYVNQ
jgi:hypothetical protein